MDSGITVLVVDDEEGIRDVAQKVLSEFGYGVVTASSGEEALERCASCGKLFDLVFLDLSMPGMGGVKCLNRLLEIYPEIKVVVSSGSEEEEHNMALANGAVDFLSKPYRISELLRLVNKIITPPA